MVGTLAQPATRRATAVEAAARFIAKAPVKLSIVQTRHGPLYSVASAVRRTALATRKFAFATGIKLCRPHSLNMGFRARGIHGQAGWRREDDHCRDCGHVRCRELW